jgi:putative flippase GtrA
MIVLPRVLVQNGVMRVGRLSIASTRAIEVARWWVVGIAFLFINLPLLYALHELLGLPVWLATLVGGEIGTVGRFLVNDRWVFGNRRPTWARLMQYHIAVASSFVIWWTVTNALAQAGLNYLIANVAAQGASVGWSMITNFGWIWRRSPLRTSHRPERFERLRLTIPRPRLATWSPRARRIDATATLEPAVASMPVPLATPSAVESVSAGRRDWRRQLLASHHLPILFLVAAAAFTFQQSLFFGYRLIGNSDRLNHYISFILYHTHYLERGQFAAWSDYVFDGFDTTSLPMSFPTPLYALPTLLHTDDVVTVFGVIAFLLLAITLVETYAVIYVLCRDRIAAIAGATTYAGATYGLLKLVQSDQTYLSVLTAPIFFYLIHTTTQRNWVRRFAVLTLLVAIECYFAFLQEFSYNLIFFFVYAAYLFLRKNRYPLLTFAAAFLAGVIVSLPRLLAQYATLDVSGRGRSAPVLQDTVDLRTLLRFFSRDIFGHSWRDQLQIPVRLNLHEGDLLHSSVFGSLLLVVIIVSFAWLLFRATRPGSALRSYGIVFVPYILFVFAVMHVQPVYLLFARLYLNVSFQHSRITVSAMLPVAILTAIFLAANRGRLTRRDTYITIAISAVAIAVSAVNYAGLLDHLRAHAPFDPPTPYFSCDGCLPHVHFSYLFTSDFVRLVVLTLVFGATVVAGFAFGARGRRIIATVLAVVIVFQTVTGAADYVEGPQTRDYSIPYETNDFVTARANQFQPPTDQQRAQLQGMVDSHDYRSVTVCPRSYPNCSTTIGMTWGVRLADGYLSGVPRRLAVLPDLHTELHELRYTDPSSLVSAWRTLGFLNVRQALVVDRDLYMNSDPTVPGDVTLIANPSSYIYPRAYFAAATRAVDIVGDEQAVQDELKACDPTCGSLHRRFPVDYVEGGQDATYDATGDLTWSGGGDRLAFDFPASDRPRFLVVNELWDSGWSAYVDQQQVPVLPTNVAMRGVLVPPGATHVEMGYRSLLWWGWWYTPAVAALLAIGLFLLRKRFRDRQSA